MSTPTVSIVMPVFNVERFVGAAVRSALDQTFGDFELIIVDDGGHDASMDICRSFHDPRIRLISQANRGLAGARNSGIAAARGRYIAFLDSDDLWNRDKLMLHVIHLEADAKLDVSYSGSRMIDESGRVLNVAMRPKLTGISAAHILKRNPIGNGSAPVIRRNALDRTAFAHPEENGRVCWFDESFRQSEDIEMWLRMAAKHGCRFEGIEGLLTDYRIAQGGLSANIARQFESWQRAMAKAKIYAPNLIARHLHRATAYQLRYLARRAIQLGDGPFAASLMREALTTSPSIIVAEPVKTLVTLAATVAARWLSPDHFRALIARRVGTGQAA
jgi:glycosyltransferase involved in cell wall biosynthesis